MSKININLTQLDGWEALTDGDHLIQIKSIGTGYASSDLSAPPSV